MGEGLTMQDDFLLSAQEVVGTLLSDMGFALSSVDDNVDEGGRIGAVLYYYGPDCKVQLYRSSREGEINAMIGPLQAPDEFGPHNRSHMWHYFNEYADEPKLSLEQMVANIRAESDHSKTTNSWLAWLKNERIARYYESARAGILKQYGTQE
jgi:hypothetical protein